MSKKIFEATSVANGKTYTVVWGRSLHSTSEYKKIIPVVLDYIEKLYGKHKFHYVGIDDTTVYIMELDGKISLIDINLIIKENCHD